MHRAVVTRLSALLLLGFSASVDAAAVAQVNTGSVNGIQIKELQDLSKSLKDNPKSGQASFFSKSKWQDGMRSVTTISGYTIDGKKKHQTDRSFTLQGDEMLELGGKDSAPGAVEELMYATGTCIVAAANANAALMGIKLTKLEVELESQIDLHGLMALDEKVRPGILDFKTKITIAGDADEVTLKKIALAGYKYSPVSDTVRNGVAHAAEPEIVVIK